MISRGTKKKLVTSKPGYLYVMLRSDGLVKVGRTNNVSVRIHGHQAQTDNRRAGVQFRPAWVSKWRDDINVAERRMLESLVEKNRMGARRETVDVSVQVAIRAAKAAMRA